MTDLITRKDSLAGKLKGRLTWWLMGAAGALLLAGLALGPTGAQAQTAGATYTGTIPTDADTSCGGGTISVTVGSAGDDITSVSVTNISDGTATMSGTISPAAGAVPIGSDGSFSTYFPADSAEVTVDGTFSATGLSGSLLIDPSTCGPISFSAVAGAAVTPVSGLPPTGNGSDGSSGAPWAVVAGAMAVLGLGAGFVFLRRRSA